MVKYRPRNIHFSINGKKIKVSNLFTPFEVSLTAAFVTNSAKSKGTCKNDKKNWTKKPWSIVNGKFKVILQFQRVLLSYAAISLYNKRYQAASGFPGELSFFHSELISVSAQLISSEFPHWRTAAVASKWSKP